MNELVRRLHSALVQVRMSVLNRWSGVTISGEGPTVSLTTYGKRYAKVHLTIESIVQGRLSPKRLILWIDEPELLRNPTPGLKRLLRRGLEIRPTEDFGPHKKYFPYVRSIAEHVEPLVTADDDVFYESEWLERLADQHALYPDDVIAYRARRITLSSTGFAPYSEWPIVASDTSSRSVFPTGVRGVLYPPAFLDHLRIAGTAFLDVCPRADDVWLHANAIRSGRRARQIDRALAENILPVLGSGDSGLWATNVEQGGNDRQISATYDSNDIASIREDVSAH